VIILRIESNPDISHAIGFVFIAVNVFAGIQNNPLFCIILITTAVLQCLIVQFGSVAFHVAEDGLSAKYWGISLALGAISLPVQQVINVAYAAGLQYKGFRMKRRLAKDGHLSTRHANGSASSVISHSHRE
jgi:hypothetical protein